METKQFYRGNHILEFYRENQGEKFRFRLYGEEKLTEQLLAVCKHKEVKEKDLRFAVRGIFEKLRDLPKLQQEKKQIPIRKYEQDDASYLNEICQKLFGQNLDCRLVSQSGAPHLPTIKVRVTTPDGKTAEAHANSQKVARQRAAKRLLEFYVQK